MAPTPEKRWYQVPYLWLVIGIPVVAVSVSMVNVYLAVSTSDDEVRTIQDDIYQEGRTINQRFEREAQAEALAIHADVRVDEVTGEVLLRLSANQPIQAPTLSLNFEHQTRSREDQLLTLQRVMGNDYHGQLDRELNGIYRVELATADWRMVGTQRFPKADATFSLDPM